MRTNDHADNSSSFRDHIELLTIFNLSDIGCPKHTG